MNCGTEEWGCGCEELVELNSGRSLPVIEQAMDCGDGSCGCGCVDVSDLDRVEAGE